MALAGWQQLVAVCVCVYAAFKVIPLFSDYREIGMLCIHV